MNRSYSEEEQSSNEVKQYICLLGQDFYHEMRKNNDIEVEISVNKKREEYCKNRDARGKLVFPMLYKNNGSEEKKKQEEADAKDTEMISVSTRQVWQTLLKDGPERGIHSLWQLNNVNKFFHNTENHVYMRDLEKYFSSIAFLRMPEEDSRFSTVKMDLQKLNSDFENLQLALYSLEKSDYELLSPYVQPTGEEIERLLYKEQ